MWRKVFMLCILALCASVKADDCPSHCTCSGQYPTTYECKTANGDTLTLQGDLGYRIDVNCPWDLTCADYPSIRYTEGTNTSTLRDVVTHGCLPAQLPCLLNALHVNDVKYIKLYSPRAPLTAADVRGLNTDFLAYHDTDNLSIPSDVLRELRKLKTLFVFGGQLTLTSGAFQDATELDFIKLKTNITEVPPGTFRGLAKLKTLQIWGDNIRIHRNSFEGLTALDDFDLPDNMIDALPEGVFSSMPLLRYLNLNNNNFQELTSGVFTSQNLEQIRISNNKRPLTIGSRTFADLPKLNGLHLDGCGISSLPVDVFQGTTGLTKLILRNNQLSELPENVLQNLQALQELDLGGNKFTALNFNWFESLKKLTTLELNNNQIQALPDELPAALRGSRISFLDLSGNQLTSLNSGNIHFLSLFNSVKLSDNKIAKVLLGVVKPPNQYIWQNPPDPYNPPSIDLEGNPFVCDCELYPLSLMARGGRSTTVAARIELYYATCASPEDKKGLIVKDIPPEQLNCLEN